MDFTAKEKSETTQRLDRINILSENFNRCAMSPYTFDDQVKRYSFETMFSLLKAISEEIPNLNDDEIKRDLDYRKKIQIFLIDNPVFRKTYEASYGGRERKKNTFILDNWLALESLLSQYHRFIQDLIADKFKHDVYTDSDSATAIDEEGYNDST